MSMTVSIPANAFIVFSVEMSKSSGSHVGSTIRSFQGVAVGDAHVPEDNSASGLLLPLDLETAWKESHD